MNKLFTKIAALSVGLAMAIGVGVAIGSKRNAVRVRAAEGSVTVSSASSNTDGVVTVAISQASGSSAPITGDYGVRLYANNTVTISAADNITSLTIPWTKNPKKDFATVTADVGTYTHPSAAGDGTWSGSAKTIVLTVGTGQIQFNSVSYTTEGGSTTTYTISYNSNGGTGTMENTTGPNPIVASCSFTAPEGKTFSKWCTNSSGTGGTDYAPGDQPGADVSLYAIWEDLPTGGTINFGSASGKTQINDLQVVGTDSGGVNWTVTTEMSEKSFTQSADYSQVGSSNKPATSITFTATLPEEQKIIGFSAKFGGFNSTAGDITLKVGDTTVGTGALNAGSDVIVEASDVTQSGTSLSVTVTNIAKGVKVYYVSYETEAGEDPELDTLTVLLNDATPSPLTLPYSSTGAWLFYADDKDGNFVNASWTSSDENVFTVTKNGNNVAVVTPHNGGTATLKASAEGFNDGLFVLTVDVGSIESIAVAGSMSKTEYTTSESWSPNGLVVTGTYDTGYVCVVTSQASWTYAPAAPAEGVTSVVATASVGEVSGSSTAQSVTVTVSHSGTQDDPFTVEEARAQIDGGTDLNDKYVTGIVSKIDTPYSTQHLNVSFSFSADGTTSVPQLQAFREKSDYSSTVKVGDTVVVGGNLKKYNSTYELDAGCAISSLVPAPDPETVTSIEDIYTASLGSPVEIDGYFVGAVSDGIYLMDGEYGIFVYKGTAPEGAVVNETKLHVVGTTTTFHNLYQIAQGATITVNASAEVATPINYTLTGSESASDLSITSRRLLEKGTITSIVRGENTYEPTYVGDVPTVDTTTDIFLTINGIQVIYKKSDVTQAVFDLMFGYLLEGKKVNVEAFTSFFDSNFQLRFSSVVEATEGYTAEQFASDLISSTDAVCENYDGVTDNKAALAPIWLELQQNVLSDEEIARFNTEDAFAAARARYDYLVGKYGLTDFLLRNPAPISYINSALEINNNSNTMIIIISVAAVSAIALATLLIFKKKKHN